ncbi:hypothetical protein P153DRAFT_332115 [Dothidotthia symphoricarpi CBS 119687]|uniref:Histone transcription regulator 3 homolog n=1 Tax=Dothidotthia symphoricarpi CBS 119687 TaxID=1392245 RepID=A0A6A6AQC0_9PLEO|nr:uncharacterized protein P153DRAFT_332115 [Dothidotthia symphoricarpi CBS 119687]KAF2133393.1 hypothetical protein P153DRAFT_332115 [Dothidotthia symphoricarpi CBS 119687]
MSKASKASKASTWHPWNVEAADIEAEEEVDDTQEIQIEEALKLYQTALKYHTEGPQSFDKTAAAYKALFESDIFKYTESLSEYQRHELFGETLVFDSILEDDYDAGPTQSTGAAESAPNTLPQILHLSYKNHGQFLLESMQHCVSQQGGAPGLQGRDDIRGALSYFAEALDKEDTDLDLWLRAASVAAMLGSQRLTRFCLEAVLDGNDELWEGLLRLPGLEEGFAGQQLRELVEKLEDNVSLMQAPLTAMKRKKLSETLKKRLNPYPFAPLPADVTRVDGRRMLSALPEPVVLNPTKWDWAGAGESVLQQYLAEQRGVVDIRPGSSINFNIPPDSEISPHIEPEPMLVIENTTAASPDDSMLPQVQQSLTSSTEPDTAVGRVGDDAVMQDQVDDLGTKIKEARLTPPPEVAPASSRKRSPDSAGLPETAEGGRYRSKRIRARDSMPEPGNGGDRAPHDGNRQLEEQLEPYTHADQCLYEIVKDIYSRLGVEGIEQPKKLRDMLTALPETSATNPIDKAACDMFTALQSGDPKTAQVLLSNESFDLVGQTREAGLNAFLGYTKSSTRQACVKPTLDSQRLVTFTRSVNEGWLSTKEVAFAWLEVLLSRGSFATQHDGHSSYMQFRWTENLKRILVQIIVNIDEHIYERMLDRINNLSTRMLKARHQSQKHDLSEFDTSQIEIVQILFELHLDVYSLIKHPHSQVDIDTQVIQSDRLERWATLAREAMQLRTDCEPDLGMDDLALRHIWASVFQMSVKDEIPPEHVISALGDLKSMFEALDDHTIQLQNNAVMPELSVAAVDRELVRISMKDFFLKVFDQEEKDPVAIIESLEPILETVYSTPELQGTDPDEEDASASRSPTTTNVTDVEANTLIEMPSPVVEMRKFLDSANVNVRLSLWQRLRVAYDAIEYPPKVLSCYLRSIETFVGDLRTTNFQELSAVERQVKLLTRDRVIDDMVVKILQIVRSEKTAFECLTYEHVLSSMSAIAELLHIMSAANVLRDLIRIGQVPMPRIEAQPSQAFISMSARLDDMYLRLWMLQYHLLKEGLSQNREKFPTPSEDMFEFLRHVHHATGVRGLCHSSNRQFLRLVKDEVLRLDDVIDANNRDNQLCQVLHDLYGLKLFIEPLDCQDYQSPPDVLDKKTAYSLLPFVMSQAARVDIKDLPKTELKSTIEKVHAALGRPKQHDDISFNRKLISAYFKSAINPVSLFSCLKGIGLLPTKHIPDEEAVAASKGWYYMMGNIALSKFRSQKRMTQGPTEEINYAQAFFVQDLEYSIERWETWYRLALANDIQLEEAVMWNADKMNSNSVELVNYQRASINCYLMAVACVVRSGNTASHDQENIARLYTDFGDRIYASSREPFSMEAFDIRDGEKRFCNHPTEGKTYRSASFVTLQAYTAWKFASTLYKRAIKGNSKKWWNYYMLGKCGWKMWSANHNAILHDASNGTPMSSRRGPSWEEVIDAFISAIEILPGKKGRNGEPVLEPHYKLVSIVHKLFQRKAISHEKGTEILTHTSYAKNISPPKDANDWERYIIAVLKSLRSADKSSWHHRIIARSAHVIYDGGEDMTTAHGAKHELTQQMFTKTMAVQVWKPEHERPGRHFVYTTRYTKFFIHLLDVTEDKASFEALAKRVPRKQTDFFEHSKLWQELCLQYLKMLRRTGQITDGQEDYTFKSLSHDDFNILAPRIEAWCRNPATQHPVLDILRDAIELKRLNSGLMKPLLIDDLIGDTYAVLYAIVGPTLLPLPSEQQQQQPIQLAHFGPNPTVQQSSGVMPISSLMSVQLDGSVDTTAPTPFAVYHPSQLQPQQQVPPHLEPQVKSRTKAMGRKEIQRRAEACVQKPVAPPTTNIAIRSPPASTAVLPTRNTSPEKPSTEHLHVSFDKSGTATAAASVSNDEPEHSAPSSIHDDADDESELSELDDEEVHEIGQEVERRSASIVAIKPLFPNLVASRNGAGTEKRQDGAGSSWAGRDGGGDWGDGGRMDVDGAE